MLVRSQRDDGACSTFPDDAHNRCQPPNDSRFATASVPQKLQPGAYLIRWRVHARPMWQGQLSVSAALAASAAGSHGRADDAAVPDLLLTEVPEALRESHRAKVALKARTALPAARGQPQQSPAELEGAWRLLPHTEVDFGFLNVAVARVAVPADLSVRIWKHTGSWVHNVAVDYVEARTVTTFFTQHTPAPLARQGLMWARPNAIWHAFDSLQAVPLDLAVRPPLSAPPTLSESGAEQQPSLLGSCTGAQRQFPIRVGKAPALGPVLHDVRATGSWAVASAEEEE